MFIDNIFSGSLLTLFLSSLGEGSLSLSLAVYNFLELVSLLISIFHHVSYLETP